MTELITVDDLQRGYQACQDNELRANLYVVARRLVAMAWENDQAVTDSVILLLYAWNNIFYRSGGLDADCFKRHVGIHYLTLKQYRKRVISSFNERDCYAISDLFRDFLEATASYGLEVRYSPVSVSKVLHILAPHFFPVWDRHVAKAYGYNTQGWNDPVADYLDYIDRIKTTVSQLLPLANATEKTFQVNGILNAIWNYQYAKFSRHWI